MRSDTTSPGTRFVTGTRLARPSLRTSASCRILARRAAIATSARYSLKKPRPTLSADDHGDDHRVRAATSQPRHERRPEQEDQDRVPDLTEEARPWHAPDAYRARSARTVATVPPHRQTRAHQAHSQGVRAPRSGSKPAASPKSNSPKGAFAATPKGTASPPELNATSTIVSHRYPEHGYSQNVRSPSKRRPTLGAKVATFDADDRDCR